MDLGRLQRASEELHAFLEKESTVRARPALRVSLLQNEDHTPLPLRLEEPLVWPETCYAWFGVGAVPGGTDAYCATSSEFRSEVWNAYLEREGHRDPVAHLQRDREIPHHWRFRRSAGQPAVINLAYGLLAASLASLTEGIVFSDDNAWDYGRFPARADDFLSWYFRPGQALDPQFRDWAVRCVASLPEELAAGGEP